MSLPPVTCLLVDDLEENLLALSALLQREGVELLLARSGVAALDLLLKHDVALAILDVQMPEMDGFELAELMRGSERTRHVPLIFVTAGAHDRYRLFKGYDTGAVDFLYKPIEPQILKNKADVFFELYRQKQQLQLELRKQTEMLRLNEMFAAVLGHDLRTPLSAILTAGQLLQRRSDDEGVQRIAARVLSSGLRMTRMIEDLLDLTRARLAGGIPITRARTDLGALMQRVVQEHQVAFPGRALEMVVDGHLEGDWDADRIAQVASNLVGNALQHGAAGEAVRVRVDGTADDAVVFSVTNAGLIDAKLLPQIFEPFHGGPRDGTHEGLGLGLYIAQQIVHAHEGRIDVYTEGGARTVFCVRVRRLASKP